MNIVLIRHGKTIGNQNKEYIGRSDQPILSSVEDEILKIQYPKVDAVFSSPLKRAIQTAQLIFKEQNATIVDKLIECDFGDFEGKTYDQLKDNPDYQHWIDSGGIAAFPNGEDGISFRKRCVDAFYSILDESILSGYHDVGIVCHGGTIMAILDGITEHKKGFYHWQVKNLYGYIVSFDEKIKPKFSAENITDLI